MYLKSIFLLLLIPFLAFAKIPPDSKPRHDLYKKIKQTTGVSLKDAYRAVFEGDKKARYDLSQYAKIKGTKDVVQGFELEIKDHKKRCQNAKDRIPCNRQVLDLVKQRDFISGLDKEIVKNPKLSLYKSLVVVGYVVRHEILKTSYSKWKKECSSQKKINTLKCKKQFFETDILYSIVRDLAQVSYSKATNRTASVKKGEIKKLVARYE